MPHVNVGATVGVMSNEATIVPDDTSPYWQPSDHVTLRCQCGADSEDVESCGHVGRRGGWGTVYWQASCVGCGETIEAAWEFEGPTP